MAQKKALRRLISTPWAAQGNAEIEHEKGQRMMDGYVTIADFGEWSIVEEYRSEKTIQESERILEYCNERERRNHKIKAKRKKEIKAILSSVILGVISVGCSGIIVILWILEII